MPLAKKSSGCDSLKPPLPGELHLWLCRRQTTADSENLLRRVLSFYTDSALDGMRITRGPQGKPALLSPALPLDFNFTDSGDWQAMAVSDGAPVGIDLEFCEPRREVLKLARRWFSAAELADLQACDPGERLARFYDYWTLKEASIKAAGGSLGRELETANFSLLYPGCTSGSHTTGKIAALPPLPTSDAWYGLLQPLNDYRLGLCCLSPLDFADGLRLFELANTDDPVDRPFTLRAGSGDQKSTVGVFHS